MKRIPDSSGPEDNAFAGGRYGDPREWSWHRPLRLTGEVLYGHPRFWLGLGVLAAALLRSPLPFWVWVPVVHALATGAAEDHLLEEEPPTLIGCLRRWGHVVPAFLFFHGATYLAAAGLWGALLAGPPPASLAALALIGLLGFTALVVAYPLIEGDGILRGGGKATRLVVGHPAAAIRLAVIQLTLVLLLAAMGVGGVVQIGDLLGREAGGSLLGAMAWAGSVLATLPSALALLWAFVGWVFWTIREDEVPEERVPPHLVN